MPKLYIRNDDTGDIEEYQLTESFTVAVTDEVSAVTEGEAKLTFRMPFAMELTELRGSLIEAQDSGNLLTVDVTHNGNSIFSTLLTFDNAEETTITANTPAVLTLTSLEDDAEIAVSVSQIGDGTAKGLKVTFYGEKV